MFDQTLRQYERSKFSTLSYLRLSKTRPIRLLFKTGKSEVPLDLFARNCKTIMFKDGPSDLHLIDHKQSIDVYRCMYK